MDPTANLEHQLRLASKLLLQVETGADCQARDIGRLCELVIALDEWIRRGGFLPTPWGSTKKAPDSLGVE